MAKNVKRSTPATGQVYVRGQSSKAAKTAAASALTQRPNKKGGSFADGVKVISRRDRAGLIKLADK